MRTGSAERASIGVSLKSLDGVAGESSHYPPAPALLGYIKAHRPNLSLYSAEIKNPLRLAIESNAARIKSICSVFAEPGRKTENLSGVSTK